MSKTLIYLNTPHSLCYFHRDESYNNDQKYQVALIIFIFSRIYYIKLDIRLSLLKTNCTI